MMVKEFSGKKWVGKFPDAKTTASLSNDFRPGCEAFILAMRSAGATVTVTSTRRPAERAYLMHFCWRIFKQTINPQNVPAKAGVDIEWVHTKADGSIDLAASRAAAKAMVNAYGIAYPPALKSRHTEGRAIDMTIKWSGNLVIANRDNTPTTVTTRRATASILHYVRWVKPIASLRTRAIPRTGRPTGSEHAMVEVDCHRHPWPPALQDYL